MYKELQSSEKLFDTPRKRRSSMRNRGETTRLTGDRGATPVFLRVPIFLGVPRKTFIDNTIEFEV